MTSIKVQITLSALAAFATNVYATEGGGSIYPVGTENYVCCALPPPGVYGMVFAQSYKADRVRGNDGQVVTPSTFKVRATALAPRLVWVTEEKIVDASLAFHAILPMVDLDVNIAPGVSQRKSGLGDMVFGPALGWHHSQNLHSVLALDVYAPTGSYRNGDLANIGRNHWAVQPVLGFSLINPNGLNADVKAMYTFNMRNSATQYKSGDELIVDYSLGWGLGNGWTVGAGGYIYRQTTDDKVGEVEVPNNKGKAFSIGPSIKYDSGKGWFVTAKYQKESGVRNRAEGEALWVKAVFPF